MSKLFREAMDKLLAHYNAGPKGVQETVQTAMTMLCNCAAKVDHMDEKLNWIIDAVKEATKRTDALEAEWRKEMGETEEWKSDDL